jgi:hypothetical protein
MKKRDTKPRLILTELDEPLSDYINDITQDISSHAGGQEGEDPHRDDLMEAREISCHESSQTRHHLTTPLPPSPAVMTPRGEEIVLVGECEEPTRRMSPEVLLALLQEVARQRREEEQGRLPTSPSMRSVQLDCQPVSRRSSPENMVTLAPPSGQGQKRSDG